MSGIYIVYMVGDVVDDFVIGPVFDNAHAAMAKAEWLNNIEKQRMVPYGVWKYTYREYQSSPKD